MGKHVPKRKNPILHPKSSKPPRGKGWKFNETVKHKRKNGGFYKPGKK